MVCQRCRGLLVCDNFYDLNINADPRYITIRCINCGHIEDAVVRANRARWAIPGSVQLASAHGVFDVDGIELPDHAVCGTTRVESEGRNPR